MASSGNSGGNGLVVEREQGLAVVRIDRPAHMNTLSPEVLAQLSEAVPMLITDPAVRAIMLTGTGTRAFCAGADVTELGGPFDPDRALDGLKAWHHWMIDLRCCEKLVVSAVNGAAAGGGFGIAMVADLVVAAETAVFKGAFATLGVTPDFGLGYSLPRAVGDKRAMEIISSDRRVSAAEAQALGMVAQVFPAHSFAADARAYAHGLAAGARGMQLAKRLMRRGERAAFADYLLAEAHAQVEAFASEDANEGVRAFQERRVPRFVGR
ncbi:MAG TPA: enoyl-CoA hydratase/isomerase family protein [Novosphingobium sp.]|nr:enoyl-CoA hydratase/isomerase family protein [Novosphingobium sp.]